MLWEKYSKKTKKNKQQLDVAVLMSFPRLQKFTFELF